MFGNPTNNLRGFEPIEEAFRKYPQCEPKMPTRSDMKSAGYDFYLPCDVTLRPKECLLVFTDIKAYMQQDEVLTLHIRSSIGVKLGVVLANCTGIIDASYYGNADNDGNIGLPLLNTTNKVVELKKGERIAQGMFTKYLVADNEEVLNAVRNGGFGSSGK